MLVLSLTSVASLFGELWKEGAKAHQPDKVLIDGAEEVFCVKLHPQASTLSNPAKCLKALRVYLASKKL